MKRPGRKHERSPPPQGLDWWDLVFPTGRRSGGPVDMLMVPIWLLAALGARIIIRSLRIVSFGRLPSEEFATGHRPLFGLAGFLLMVAIGYAVYRYGRIVPAKAQLTPSAPTHAERSDNPPIPPMSDADR